MENKKTFGAYICRCRKGLGLTQKEFADKLFVTESAVSKWERGLSYPDITLIRDICAVLGVSEHELLTASEDVEARNAETLAKKYLALLRRVRWTQYILYGGTALICLICNLAVDHGLTWFWLVLTGEMVGASLTLLPVLVKQYRGAATLGGFTLSLELLLLASCLFSGGDWFLLASAGVLFGLGMAFLPVVLRELPKPLGNIKRCSTWERRPCCCAPCSGLAALTAMRTGFPYPRCPRHCSGWFCPGPGSSFAGMRPWDPGGRVRPAWVRRPCFSPWSIRWRTGWCCGAAAVWNTGTHSGSSLILPTGQTSGRSTRMCCFWSGCVWRGRRYCASSGRLLGKKSKKFPWRYARGIFCLLHQGAHQLGVPRRVG